MYVRMFACKYVRMHGNFITYVNDIYHIMDITEFFHTVLIQIFRDINFAVFADNLSSMKI